MKILND